MRTGAPASGRGGRPWGEALHQVELDERGTHPRAGLVAAELAREVGAQEATQHLEVAQAGLGLGLRHQLADALAELPPGAAAEPLEHALVERDRLGDVASQAL